MKQYRECNSNKCPYPAKHAGNKYRTTSLDDPYYCPHCMRQIKPIIGNTTIEQKIKGYLARMKEVILMKKLKLIVCIMLSLIAAAGIVLTAVFTQITAWTIVLFVALGLLIIGFIISMSIGTKPGGIISSVILSIGAIAVITSLCGLAFGKPVTSNDTEEPIEIESEETTEIPLPTTPAISASLDGTNFSNQGEYINSNLGERMTFTNRKIVVPDKAWNETLSESELKTVEMTWVHVKIDVAVGTTGVVFAGGLEQGAERYENGVLLSLKPGTYNFNLRNGEVVIWYPSQGTYQSNDLTRIIEQIKNGNFDIKSELEFFGVSADLLPSIPDDLVKDKNIQIINDLTPTTAK